MKKAVIFVVLAMVVISFCAAQSANDAQRIVGTWVSEQGYTYVFNANGTGTSSGSDDSHLNGNIFWGISISGNVSIKYSGYSSQFKDEIYLSPDSKRILYRNKIFQKK